MTMQLPDMRPSGVFQVAVCGLKASQNNIRPYARQQVAPVEALVMTKIANPAMQSPLERI